MSTGVLPSLLKFGFGHDVKNVVAPNQDSSALDILSWQVYHGIQALGDLPDSGFVFNKR